MSRPHRESRSAGVGAVIMVLVAAGVTWLVHGGYLDRTPDYGPTEHLPAPSTDGNGSEAATVSARTEGDNPERSDAVLLDPTADRYAPESASASAPASALASTPAAASDAVATALAKPESPPANTDNTTADAAPPAGPGDLVEPGDLSSVNVTRTDVGLTRFEGAPRGTYPDNRPASSKDDALRPWRIRLELDPSDSEALEQLVQGLVSEDRLDEALDEAARHTAASTWVSRLDPLLAERSMALTGAAQRCVDNAVWFHERTLVLNAAVSLYAARTLVPAADTPLEPSLLSQQERLTSRRDGIARLAHFGAPLPDEVRPKTGLSRSPRRRGAIQESWHEASTADYIVRTPISPELASLTATFLEGLRPHLESSLQMKGYATGRPVEVWIVDGASAVETLRQSAEESLPPWRTTFWDGAEQRIVALDPRSVGDPLERLWGRLARESARQLVRAVTSVRGLPRWLEEGLCVRYEGATMSADGSIRTDRWPTWRLRDIALSLSHHGEPALTLDAVLDPDPGDPRTVTWAWSLVTFLAEAEDDQGERLWAPRLTALLDQYRDSSLLSRTLDFTADESGEAATRDIRRVIVTHDDPVDGVDSLRVFATRWQQWFQKEGALLRGDPGAFLWAITRAQRHMKAKRRDQAAWLLRRVVSADPFHAEAWRLLVDVENKRREIDAAILAGRHLAALREPDHPDRWKAVAGVKAVLAPQLAQTDEAERAELGGLVDRYLDVGFPRAALRLADRIVVARPLDSAWRARRAKLAAALNAQVTSARQRLPVVRNIDRLHGDKLLWQPTGQSVEVRCADHLQPEELRGAAEVSPPFTLSVEVEFFEGPDGLIDDRTNFAGLTFGASHPEAPGLWGVFLSPRGRVELATQGQLEWPSTTIGHGRAGGDHLAIHVTSQTWEVEVNGKSLGRRPLGSRPHSGWVALYTRRVDARFSDLVITRPRLAEPATIWFAGSGW